MSVVPRSMPITVSAVCDSSGAVGDGAGHDEVVGSAAGDGALTEAVAIAKHAKAIASTRTMHDIDRHTLLVSLLRRQVFIAERYGTHYCIVCV